MKPKSPTVLIILDGWGVAPSSEGNAITLARTPFYDTLVKKYPNTTLNATGLAVGLEKDQRSGSETGHMNLGAGRIVEQDVKRISNSINTGYFFNRPEFLLALSHIKKNGSDLHLMGLLSDIDSPHSNPDHLIALLILAKKHKINKVFLHLFTDGRDTHPRSAQKYLRSLNVSLKRFNFAKIATIGGRFYAMDRVKKWERLIKAYNAMVLSEGEIAKTPEEAIEKSYKKNITDEFIPPTVIADENNNPVGRIKDNDAIIFFNLRSDRARQLTKLFLLKNFGGQNNFVFPLSNIFFVGMTDFGPDLPGYNSAFGSVDVEETLPWTLRDLKQLYIAESEKYAHITYFFNGGFANPVGNEERVMVESPKVKTYDKEPEMAIKDLNKVILNNIKYNIYDFYAINFANTDMVGHTGNIKAAVKAVEAVDNSLSAIVENVLRKDGNVIITADHGNAEEMLDPKTGEISTSHSKNPVPFIIAGNKSDYELRNDGVLANVSPTILEVMRKEKSQKMTEQSLIM